MAGTAIASYLRTLSFPPENYDIQGGRLAEYIEAQVQLGELTDWTIFVPEGNGTMVELGGRQHQSVERQPRADRSTSSRFIVKSILNPSDESIDLDATEFAHALRQTNDDRRLEQLAETNRPSGPSIRSVRGRRPHNGLLIVYPIDPSVAQAGTARPLIGIVVSFPDSQKALSRIYVENTVSRREQSW